MPERPSFPELVEQLTATLLADLIEAIRRASIDDILGDSRVPPAATLRPSFAPPPAEAQRSVFDDAPDDAFISDPSAILGAMDLAHDASEPALPEPEPSVPAPSPSEPIVAVPPPLPSTSRIPEGSELVRETRAGLVVRRRR